VNLNDLQTLLDYHYWARDRMLDAAEMLTPEQYLKDLGNSFKSVRDTVVHTYSAEWNWYSRWNSRWNGTSPTAMLDPGEFPDLASVRAAWRSHEKKVREFVAELGEKNVDRVFEYRLMNGQEARSVFFHMLQHVVNHATYHRGQITTMMRQLGAAVPKSQDLIAYYRERGVL
jgi:uncharacterized damage-inducible protein DinB